MSVFPSLEISHSKEKSTQVLCIIAPDKASGDDFGSSLIDELKQQGNNRPVEYVHAKIPPRVIGGEITTNPEAVSQALAQIMQSEIEKGVTDFTIACNTLSLPLFIDATKEILSRAGYEPGSYSLTTTLDSLKAKERHSALFLGTKPVSKALAGETWTTGINYESQLLTPESREAILDLVQEVIWRTKAKDNSDVSTAPIYQPPLEGEKNLETLRLLVDSLITILEKLGVKEIIFGCTELPIAFALATRKNLPFQCIDPAHVVAQSIA